MKTQAIAVCRVSTSEQKLNGSLSRQSKSVLRAAVEIDAEIVKTWSGDVSSKRGTNVNRPDLKEMVAFCKINKRIKYLIVDEPDRFMRSIDEAFYFEVLFRELGVKVHYASDNQLNTDDMKAKILRFMKYFSAEGSNEERIQKSITGHLAALKEGRYTFPPKPGYIKGQMPGIHEPDLHTFEPLQNAFREVLSGKYAPIEALRRLNESSFTTFHSAWRMDKFKKYATDPYYAGIVEIKKQVQYRNEISLHTPMITKEEHLQLIEFFDGKTKARGPKKQYNPDFPMNKILLCGDCGGGIKFTGSKKNNGYSKKNTIYYWKYHCRGCGKAYHRKEVHDAITDTLNQITYNSTQREEFIVALAEVWEQKQTDKIKSLKSLCLKRDMLIGTKSKLFIEMVNIDSSFKSDLLIEIENIKNQIKDFDIMLETIDDLEEDLIDFMKFAFEYTNKLAKDWWKLNYDDRVRCQQLIIPGGITFNSKKKVGTPIISPIYSFQTNKKDLRENRKSLMVELAGTAPASVGLSWLVVYRHSPSYDLSVRLSKRTNIPDEQS